jgi:hypothetical protein
MFLNCGAGDDQLAPGGRLARRGGPAARVRLACLLSIDKPYLAELRIAYLSFLWLPAVVIVGLSIERRFTRIWQFVTAAMLGLVVTIAIFPFAPAASPIVIHQLSDPNLGSIADFWPIMSELRNGSVRTIDLQHAVGMVSFPSYHMVAALLIAWAAWGSRWLRWPVAATCVAMAIAIPVNGDHYLIDVIAGAILGIAVIPIARRLVDPAPSDARPERPAFND